jgi:hypothetical protein
MVRRPAPRERKMFGGRQTIGNRALVAIAAAILLLVLEGRVAAQGLSRPEAYRRAAELTALGQAIFVDAKRR